MPIQNTMTDLHNVLFEEIERLNDESLSNEDLEKEINRAKAISGVATQIMEGGKLALQVAQFKDQAYGSQVEVPKYLEA